MLVAPMPVDEADRLAALRALNILDSPFEERFDRVTRLALRLFDVPIATITLVDANRQWHKACFGLDSREADRGISFCAHTILGDGALVIPDALKDRRFADNPLVQGHPFIRFYAGYPLKDASGHNVGTLCIIDRNPRLMSEEDLQALRDLAACAERELNSKELHALYVAAEDAKGQSRAVLDATNEAILLIGPDRRIITINRRFTELFATTLPDMQGQRFGDFDEVIERIFADSAKFIDFMYTTLADTITEFKQDVVQNWPERRDLELYSLPVHAADNAFLGRLYAFRNVTQERAADRAKSEFVSMVSHELRTPLTSIKGYIDIILEGDAGAINPEQVDFLQIVSANTDRLVMLINDLLDVSRIEAGRIELNRSEQNLAVLIKSAVGSLRPQLERKNQLLTLELDPDLPQVWADPNRVNQVLVNLISNAHKYTPAGGAITIYAQQEDGFARVSVADTGIGLTPAEQDRVFERFFRAKNRTTSEVGGTGLGLAITRALVELHGGVIDFTSEAQKGSTFSFTLPIAVTALSLVS